MNFTADAQGSKLCVNGSGITFAPSATGFNVSSDNVVFGTGSGSSGSGSGSASASASASATGTAATKASSATKDYVLQFSMLAFLGALSFVVVGF